LSLLPITTTGGQHGIGANAEATKAGSPIVACAKSMPEGVLVSSEIVTYEVDGKTVAQFEIDPIDGFQPAGIGTVAGRVREASAPAIEAARELLAEARRLTPDAVQVKFGVKVTGTSSWLVARTSLEGNFEVTLSWGPGVTPPPGR
jgi:NTP-dependent ternary system trypsin peptidase co-occuring protein